MPVCLRCKLSKVCHVHLGFSSSERTGIVLEPLTHLATVRRQHKAVTDKILVGGLVEQSGSEHSQRVEPPACLMCTKQSDGERKTSPQERKCQTTHRNKAQYHLRGSQVESQCGHAKTGQIFVPPWAFPPKRPRTSTKQKQISTAFRHTYPLPLRGVELEQVEQPNRTFFINTPGQAPQR